MMRVKKTAATPVTMTFLPTEQEVEIKAASSVLELALHHKIAISHSCGGMGSCTTCLVRVQSDLTLLEPRNEIEQEMADMKGLHADERLACQLTPHQGLVVTVNSSREIE